jgi:hypothetical protein
MRVQTSYNPADYAPYDGRARNNNLASTYNPPIGLGVLNSPLPASQYPSQQPASMNVVSPLSPRQQFIQQFQKQNQMQNQQADRQVEGLQVISPTHSILSPSSPFHLEEQYSHLHLSHSTSTSTSTPTPNSHPPSSSTSTFPPDLRKGTEKEVVSPLSPERWSGATCLNDANVELENAEAKGKGKEEQGKVGRTEVETETPTGLTPSDDFKTWETWAQR